MLGCWGDTRGNLEKVSDTSVVLDVNILCVGHSGFPARRVCVGAMTRKGFGECCFVQIVLLLVA